MKKDDILQAEELDELYTKSKARLQAIERRNRKTPEELEIEYSNLKVIFALLETDEFKYSDFENISYINDFEAKEIEIFSEKYGIHKLVTYAVFIKTFRVSPYFFVDFMKENGAVNERVPKKNNRHREPTVASQALAPVGPKVGQYFLDPETGYWKIGTTADVESFEKKRKEAIYAKFDEIFFNERAGDITE